MSRKVYRRPVGRVRRLNCVLAMLLLLITGRVRKLYVRFGSSRGGCPFHVMGKTRRGNFIHFVGVDTSGCWSVVPFRGTFLVGHPRLIRPTHKRVW
jgi:hypothetical protein